MTAAPSADTPATATSRTAQSRTAESEVGGSEVAGSEVAGSEVAESRLSESRVAEVTAEESVLPPPTPAESTQAARFVVPPEAGLEGWGKGLAVVFWTAFLITVLVLAASAAVTTSSRFLAGLCGEGCDGGYRLDDLLRTTMTIAEPALALVALVAWALARRPPRTAGHGLYGLAVAGQLGLLAWALWSTYRLFLS